MNQLHVISALAEITRELREEGIIKRNKVAYLADKSEDSVRNFERGEMAPHIDRMANAIAEAAGMKPEELWTRAIARAGFEAEHPEGFTPPPDFPGDEENPPADAAEEA